MSLESIFGDSGSSKGGWTLATIFVFGIILVLFMGYITGFFSYGISYALNVSKTVNDAFYSVVGEEPPPPTTTIQMGNYTAVVPKQYDPVFDSIQSSILPLLSAIVKLLTTPEYFAIIVSITLIIMGLELRGR